MNDATTWDALNKTAILVTIFTGAPAFLVFVGFPNLAAVLLGALSISSLLFAMLRASRLKARFERLHNLHISDETILKECNRLLASTDSQSVENGDTWDSLIQGIAASAADYVTADTGHPAKARILLFTDWASQLQCTEFQAGAATQPPKRMVPVRGSPLEMVMQSGKPMSISVTDRSADYVNVRRKWLSAGSELLFPILVQQDPQSLRIIGVLSIGCRRKQPPSSECVATLKKYPHLLFLLLSNRFSRGYANVA